MADGIPRSDVAEPPRRIVPAPSLQALVDQAGGYALITDEAWRRFHGEMKRWMALLRAGALDVRPRGKNGKSASAV